MAFVARMRYSWRRWFGCSSPFHVPPALSLFSPCSESQSASDPTAAPPSMACLAGYLGRDTCRIRTAARERGGLLLTGPS